VIANILIMAMLPGIFLGISQQAFLRSLPGLRYWTLFTAATFPLVLFALVGLGLGAGNVIGAATGKPASYGLGTLVSAIARTSYLFLPTGIAQWLLLRRRLRHAWLWIPAAWLGWLAGFLALFLGYFFIARSFPQGLGLPPFLGLTLPAALLAAYEGGVTGIVLVSSKLREPSLPPGA
jgi:hypothetical protein